jgi:hypothetical protein
MIKVDYIVAVLYISPFILLMFKKMSARRMMVLGSIFHCFELCALLLMYLIFQSDFMLSLFITFVYVFMPLALFAIVLFFILQFRKQ